MKTIEGTKTLALAENIFGGYTDYAKSYILNLNNASNNIPVILSGKEGSGRSLFAKVIHNLIKDKTYLLGEYELFSEFNGYTENIDLLIMDGIDLSDYHNVMKVRKIMSEEWYTLRMCDKTDQVREKGFSRLLLTNANVNEIEELKDTRFHRFESIRTLEEVANEDFYMSLEDFIKELLEEDLTELLIK